MELKNSVLSTSSHSNRQNLRITSNTNPPTSDTYLASSYKNNQFKANRSMASVNINYIRSIKDLQSEFNIRITNENDLGICNCINLITILGREDSNIYFDKNPSIVRPTRDDLITYLKFLGFDDKNANKLFNLCLHVSNNGDEQYSGFIWKDFKTSEAISIYSIITNNMSKARKNEIITDVEMQDFYTMSIQHAAVSSLHDTILIEGRLSPIRNIINKQFMQNLNHKNINYLRMNLINYTDMERRDDREFIKNLLVENINHPRLEKLLINFVYCITGNSASNLDAICKEIILINQCEDIKQKFTTRYPEVFTNLSIQLNDNDIVLSSDSTGAQYSLFVILRESGVLSEQVMFSGQNQFSIPKESFYKLYELISTAYQTQQEFYDCLVKLKKENRFHDLKIVSTVKILTEQDVDFLETIDENFKPGCCGIKYALPLNLKIECESSERDPATIVYLESIYKELGFLDYYGDDKLFSTDQTSTLNLMQYTKLKSHLAMLADISPQINMPLLSWASNEDIFTRIIKEKVKEILDEYNIQELDDSQAEQLCKSLENYVNEPCCRSIITQLVTDKIDISASEQCNELFDSFINDIANSQENLKAICNQLISLNKKKREEKSNKITQILNRHDIPTLQQGGANQLCMLLRNYTGDREYRMQIAISLIDKIDKDAKIHIGEEFHNFINNIGGDNNANLTKMCSKIVLLNQIEWLTATFKTNYPDVFANFKIKIKRDNVDSIVLESTSIGAQYSLFILLIDTGILDKEIKFNGQTTFVLSMLNFKELHRLISRSQSNQKDVNKSLDELKKYGITDLSITTTEKTFKCNDLKISSIIDDGVKIKCTGMTFALPLHVKILCSDSKSIRYFEQIYKEFGFVDFYGEPKRFNGDNSSILEQKQFETIKARFDSLVAIAPNMNFAEKSIIDCALDGTIFITAIDCNLQSLYTDGKTDKLKLLCKMGNKTALTVLTKDKMWFEFIKSIEDVQQLKTTCVGITVENNQVYFHFNSHHSAALFLDKLKHVNGLCQGYNIYNIKMSKDTFLNLIEIRTSLTLADTDNESKNLCTLNMHNTYRRIQQQTLNHTELFYKPCLDKIKDPEHEISREMICNTIYSDNSIPDYKNKTNRIDLYELCKTNIKKLNQCDESLKQSAIAKIAIIEARMEERILGSSGGNDYNSPLILWEALDVLEKIVYGLQVCSIEQCILCLQALDGQDDFLCCNDGIRGRLYEISAPLFNNNSGIFDIERIAYSIRWNLPTQFMQQHRGIHYNETANYPPYLRYLLKDELKLNVPDSASHAYSYVTSHAKADTPKFMQFFNRQFGASLLKECVQTFTNLLNDTLDDYPAFEKLLNKINVPTIDIGPYFENITTLQLCLVDLIKAKLIRDGFIELNNEPERLEIISIQPISLESLRQARQVTRFHEYAPDGSIIRVRRGG